VLAGVEPKARHERVSSALAALSIADRSHHKPEQLSGGQRQRVAIARATITRPRVLLADEPTGNLDHKSGQDVVQILEALTTQGITLIVVTHDAELGARAARRLDMVDGRVVRDQRANTDGVAQS
jgi:putative ABC transport system ATP-binding protein